MSALFLAALYFVRPSIKSPKPPVRLALTWRACTSASRRATCHLCSMRLSMENFSSPRVSCKALENVRTPSCGVLVVSHAPKHEGASSPRASSKTLASARVPFCDMPSVFHATKYGKLFKPSRIDLREVSYLCVSAFRPLAKCSLYLMRPSMISSSSPHASGAAVVFASLLSSTCSLWCSFMRPSMKSSPNSKPSRV